MRYTSSAVSVLRQCLTSATGTLSTMLLLSTVAVVLLILSLVGTCQARTELAVLGRFGQLSNRDEGCLTNADYNLYVERGFKLVYPSQEQQADGWMGEDVFAGFITMRLPQGINQYELLIDPSSGTKVTELSPVHAVVSKEVMVSSQVYRLEARLWVNYPVVWFSSEVDRSVKEVTYAILGYDWADVTSPDLIIYESGEGLIEKRTEELERIDFGNTRNRTILCVDSHRRIGFGIVTASDEATLSFDDKGTLLVTVPNRESMESIALTTVPNTYYPWSKERSSFLLGLSSRVALGGHAPKSLTTAFGTEAGKPYVQYDLDLNSGAVVSPLLAVPAIAVREDVQAEYILPNPLGGTAMLSGTHARLNLSVPTKFEQILPDVTVVSDQTKALVTGYVQYVLRHALMDGGFDFSEGRAFYDGITCGILSQVLPLLPDKERRHTIEVIRRTLDYWWKNLAYDSVRGIWFFAEPELTDSVVDYPEITGCVLYATLAYSMAVDPGYVKTIEDELTRLRESLKLAYDPSGSAYAFAGPSFNHIIVEGTIGGYVAWASFCHLETLLGHTQEAQELAARAALAYQSIDLYNWRPEYGNGLLSEIYNASRLRVNPPDDWVWAYTMYTWYSYVPFFTLPQDDRYHLWGKLAEIEWWQHGKRTRQRAYDFANLCAFARYGHLNEALEHLEEVKFPMFWSDHFDFTPVMAISALPWVDIVKTKAELL